MSNRTTVTEFFLLGFSDVREQQILHFLMFLVIYLAALVGNLLIITVVALDQHLHTPMYFFLGNLSFLDLCYISVTIPKSMADSLTNNRLISFSGCVIQVFLVVTFAVAELAFLTVMAYDRYTAICHPLHYRVTMNRGACAQMAAASWISSMICSVLHTANTFRLHFCGSNIIAQFFCDIPQLLKISCSDTHANVIVMIALGSLVDVVCFVLIIVSYIHIFSTVMRIPSEQGRYKAFSTCIPHLVVFCLFISTASFTYMRPRSMSSKSLNLMATVLYCVVPPLMNPIIYSLRNKEIKSSLWKMIGRIFFPKKNKFLTLNS
ncbi:olfactory receptor 14A16-like [Terrapene carolina triunguis]|uniref:olfactory receptor 14A16-like n=1 Tax=Terrapene triunguis TaxID=2587831 RepID=UPI000E77E9DA|nr:olfactory receptor 14A16-like [Terrapene carolina triunguis]